MVQTSNLGEKGEAYKIGKLALEVGLYFTTLKRRGSKSSSFYYKTLEELAQKISKFSNRKSLSSNALSEALTALHHKKIFIYEKDIPNMIERHGDKRGIKVRLRTKDEYKELLKELCRADIQE